MKPKETDCCWNCKYFNGTHDDGKTICGNADQWNTWIRPEQGCEYWKEESDVGNIGTDYPSDI